MVVQTSPIVSIIIPCHNAAQTLITCLESCFNQTYPKLEIILIDNNSTDRSLTIAKSLAIRSPHPFKIIPCPEPGANAARNLGFTHAQGQYIQWLDADDTIDPDKIARQVTALNSHSNFDIAYGNWTWQFHDDPSSTLLHFTSQPPDDFLFQCLIDHWHPPHSYLLRRPAAQTLHDRQAWHPTTTVSTDREYITIAALTGFQFLYVPETHVTYHRWSDQQTTQSTPYFTRTQSLKAVFQRFKDNAQSNPTLQPHHWQLLNQSCDLWQLPPIQLTQQESQYTLHHPTATPSRAGIALTYSEAMILAALQKTSGSYRLEDHARRILHHLWKTLLHHQPLDPIALTQALSVLVGLPETSPMQPSIVTSGIPLAPNLSLSLTDGNDILTQIPPTDLIDAVPIFAPVFSIHRWAILTTLEHFRAQNFLSLVPNPT